VTALAARDDEDHAVTERRCIATGEVRPVESLVRFVVGPDNTIVPDIEGKLPGRGLWVAAERAAFEKAMAKGGFAKAARQVVSVPSDLVERTQSLLVARIKASLGLARRAGQLVQGYDNVVRALGDKIAPRLLVEACDGAHDGRRKLAAAADRHGLHAVLIDGLSSDELSLALGRANVIHAAVKPGPLAERLIVDSARLNGLRAMAPPVGNERNA
jgi:uncharacterized protein